MDDGMELCETDERHTEMRVERTIVSLHEGDITEADVDAIVNAANSHLVLGSGVAGAIREKGGPTIQAECDKLAPIPTGSAVMTGGGRLRARHVIHAVGPVAGDGDEAGLVGSATRSALAIATQNGLASVALPALSTGVFGVDKGVCARAMFEAIVTFVQQHETPVRRIELCLRGADTMQVFSAEMGRWRDVLEGAEGRSRA